MSNGGVTTLARSVWDNKWVRVPVTWIGSIVLFFVALDQIWPTPSGVAVYGIIIGSFTALLAFGLALIYRSNRVINFAQADLGAVPASLCVALVAAPRPDRDGRTGSRCRWCSSDRSCSARSSSA